MSEDQFVEKYYQMDPLREDLLFDGCSLEDGMVVLIENAEYRGYPGESLLEDNQDRLRRFNRWCVVSEVSVIYEDNPRVAFIGIYEDGTKMKISVSADIGWFVKIDTIPREKRSNATEGLINPGNDPMTTFLKEIPVLPKTLFIPESIPKKTVDPMVLTWLSDEEELREEKETPSEQS